MTLKTETLNLWRNNAEITAGETAEDDPEHIAAKAILALTAELLANREAQPVLYASEETLAYAKEDEKRLVTWSEPMGDAVIPLFTVPPAQTSGVVNLPTEFISDEGVVVRLEQVMAALALVGVKYERRGDACRAAMLAQPVSSSYTLNSPEIPDGWKLVPVEPTTEMINAALASGAISIRTAYSAMLAAAPEGGNG
ncbi:TPA: hypothetical protein ACGD7R_004377 [Serratia marcescens]